MSSVLLSYDENNQQAQQQLSMLLATGLFIKMNQMATEPLIDVDYMSKPAYDLDETFEDLYQEVGQMYGLKDIRDAK